MASSQNTSGSRSREDHGQLQLHPDLLELWEKSEKLSEGEEPLCSDLARFGLVILGRILLHQESERERRLLDSIDRLEDLAARVEDSVSTLETTIQHRRCKQPVAATCEERRAREARYAKAWCDDPWMDGEVVDRDFRDEILQRKAEFTVLAIEREGHNGCEMVDVAFNGTPTTLGPLQARLLVLSLRGHGTAGTYEDVAAKAWREPQLVKDLSELRRESETDKRAKVEFHETASRIRKGAKGLSDNLKRCIGIEFATKGTGEYHLRPPPKKYCLLKLL